MSPSSSSKKMTPEQMRVMRVHWEWAGGYALIWIIVTIVIFGGIFLMLDYAGASDSVKMQSFVLLATITILNAIWRAAGLLAARIELMLKQYGVGGHASE
jgi:hypothetical protein